MSAQQEPRRPRCVRVPESTQHGGARLVAIRSDGVDLELEMESDAGGVRVSFRDVVGFRVLEERELCEFWNDYATPNGWLWEVHEGGWLDLERTRATFGSLRLPLREWLVVDDRCVSVIGENPPELREIARGSGE